MKLNRRSFFKAGAVMAGYAVLGFNMTKEAAAYVIDFVATRQKSVYDADANPAIYKLRKSQDNPMITKIYDKKDGYLADGPCGKEAYKLLHTHYVDRSKKLEALRAKGIELSM